MKAIAGGDGAGITQLTQPSAAAMDRPVMAREGSGAIDTTTDSSPPLTMTLSQATAPCERPPTFPAPTPGPVKELKLANGRSLFFEKQRVPDPPSISFAKDLPRMMRMWDDNLPEWNPSDAVLRIRGEPIALKHWPEVYRYGKSSQWEGTKKNWAHWRVSVFCPLFLSFCNTYCLTCLGHCYELAKAHGGRFLAQIFQCPRADVVHRHL
jgi:hypothetical protein